MHHPQEPIRLLAIFHFVYAGLVVLGTLMPIFWLLTASIWWPELAAEATGDNEYIPAMATGAVVVTFASFGILLGWIWAGFLVTAGRNMLALRRHTFCLVVAGIACLAIPLGTVLGVSTLVILNREGTRELFDGPTVA